MFPMPNCNPTHRQTQHGLIGSTEWGEDFADWISQHVVAYVNAGKSLSPLISYCHNSTHKHVISQMLLLLVPRGKASPRPYYHTSSYVPHKISLTQLILLRRYGMLQVTLDRLVRGYLT
jgi:hypothetical protein